MDGLGNYLNSPFIKSKKILIVENPAELDIIEDSYPDLKDAPIILLSSNFSFNKLMELEKRGYLFFDDKITEKDAKRMAEEIHEILWSWFLDKTGTDLSSINGCSLGRAFASSLDILFNSIFRYFVGFSKLLGPEHEIYYTSNTEDIFMRVIKFLQKNVGFKATIIQTEMPQHVVMYGKKIKMDAMGRKRDLSFFSTGNWKSKWMCRLIRCFQRKSDGRKRVLLTFSAKLDRYFKYLKKEEGYNKGLRFILPVSKADIPRLFFGNKKKVLFYHFHSYGSYEVPRIIHIISKLKLNIRQKIETVDPETLISVMEHHTFPYFQGAYSLYRNVSETIKSLKPHVVILWGDTDEMSILLAQAAKHLGVKTAMLPHGLHIGGYSEYKSGTEKVFDYALAFGVKDVLDYIEQGVEKSRVRVTSYPYFEKFLPIYESKRTAYTKALILPIGVVNMVPSEKIRKQHEYIKSVISLLKDLKIDVSAIKERNMFNFRNMGFEEDYLQFNGMRIPLLSGYSSFPEAAENVDIVIGPPSTATIEAGLLGKDYFAYCHSSFHDAVPVVGSGVYKIVNVAFSIEQLRNNILNRQPYHPGHSVFDLIDLKDVKSKRDLYSKFETAISDIVN